MRQGKSEQKNCIQVAIKRYVIKYLLEHGYSPSVREIGDAVGLKSTSTVHFHIKRMIENGMLESDAEYGSPRAIRVPGYKFVKVEDDEKNISNV